jgi:homoserine O-succinyltransferase
MSGRQIFLTGHSEYDPLTLKHEYERDLERGLPIEVPQNYFLRTTGQSTTGALAQCGYLRFANWLNYYVYQETPFDLNTLF